MSTQLTFFTELSKPDDGGDVDLWGVILDGVIDAWDRQLGGVLQVNVAGGNVTLSTDQAQHGRIVAVGTPSPAADRTITIPSCTRSFVIHNMMGTANKLTVVSAGFGVSVFQNQCVLVYCDGSNMRPASHPVYAGAGVQPGGGFEAGSAGRAGLYFAGNQNLGFRASGSVIGACLGGTNDALRFAGGVPSTANLTLQLVNDPSAANPYTTGFYASANDTLDVVAGGTRRVRIDGAGRILIGRTSTSDNQDGAYFNAAGQLYLEKSTDQLVKANRYGSNGAVIEFYRGMSNLVGSIGVTPTATSFNTSSDRRIKDKITAAPDLWEKIASLQVQEFEFLADPGPRHIGLIAQDLREVFPGFVTGVPDGDLSTDGPMGVDYSKLTPVLLWAIQDLYRRIAHA